MAVSPGVVTLLKASLLRPRLLLDVPGETLDLGSPGSDDGGSSVSLTLWGHCFGTRDAWRSLLVVWCSIYLHQWRRVSAAWCSGVSVAGVC